MPHLFEKENFRVLMKENKPKKSCSCTLRGRGAENREVEKKAQPVRKAMRKKEEQE